MITSWTPKRVVLSSLLVLAGLLPLSAHADSLRLDDPERYSYAQQYLLLKVNYQREQAGVQRVQLAPLACQVAKQHADDMRNGAYFSHWNRDGLKPTRRYNLLGGYDAIGENIYYMSHPKGDLIAALDLMLETLMSSTGHRKTLLNPAYTHVGLGFAVGSDGTDFYGVQDFVSIIGGEYICQLTAQPQERIRFSGRFDPYRYSVEYVLVGYEERPEPKSVKWLMNTASYGEGKKMFAGYVTEKNIQFDKIQTFHDIEVDSDRGWFECRPLLDYKGKEGLYYLSLWLRDETNGTSVHVATVTVDVAQ